MSEEKKYAATMIKFLNLKVGDTVTRYLSSARIPMRLKVTEVTEDVITCGDWTFCRKTGAEIDHYLGFGPQYGMTGSVIEIGDHHN